jgi:pyrroloquinoline quinone (PQQ) biosynthesis protein C
MNANDAQGGARRRSASWELLYQGSAEQFIEALCEDAFAHPAVNHPYLKRLAEGDLPHMASAIRDYCHQYYFYSAQFPAYLEGVIAGLQSPAHRKVLIDNLEEERGHGAAANPEHVPHTELFQRFRRAAGVSPEYEAAAPACATALVWRDLFLQKCHSRQPGVGLGAIGIATEMMVSTIYRYLQRAVSAHTTMQPDDYIFLTLHLDCDDGHAADLKQISIELADRPEAREALRFGVLSSLNLRNGFWDVMLARALSGTGQ